MTYAPTCPRCGAALLDARATDWDEPHNRFVTRRVWLHVGKCGKDLVDVMTTPDEAPPCPDCGQPLTPSHARECVVARALAGPAIPLECFPIACALVVLAIVAATIALG